MAGEYKFLRKVVKMRLLLIKTKRSCKNSKLVVEGTIRLNTWLDTKRYQNDAAARRIIDRHRELITHILPGQGSPAHEKFTKQFNELCQQNVN